MVKQSEALEACEPEKAPRDLCGIVRPIAEMGSYTTKHWREVHNVVAEALDSIGFDLRLVSESDSSGVILTEIVTNLYADKIVIVDVSGRNPNVMFELGMRLAFEKPAIIIIDDDTPFSFDISPVKHIRYPRSLRYADMVQFKKDVATSVMATLEATEKPEYRGYLQQFGPVKVTDLGAQGVEFNSIAQDVLDIKRSLAGINNQRDLLTLPHIYPKFSNEIDRQWRHDPSVVSLSIPEQFLDEAVAQLSQMRMVDKIELSDTGAVVTVAGGDMALVSEARNNARALARRLRVRAASEEKAQTAD
jgi:hypothetical protein